MANYSRIRGEESSTVTFKAATVTQTRNSTTMHQELVTLSDANSSLGIAPVLAAAPVSTEFGLVVRLASGPSSAADLLMRPVFSSTNTDNPVRAVLSSTAADNPVSVVGQVKVILSSTLSDNTVRALLSSTSTDNPVRALLSSTSADNPVNATLILGGLQSSVAPPGGSSGLVVRIAGGPSSAADCTIRAALSSTSADNPVNATVLYGGLQSSGAPSSGSSGVIVRQVWDLRLTAASSNAFVSSAFSIASSGAGLNTYVTGYSITTTNAGPGTAKFYSSGTMIWPIVFAAVSSVVTGANLAVYPYLFKTNNAAEAMTLNLASSQAGWKVGVSYYRAP